MNKKILLNIGTTVLQILVTGILYYLLYKIILAKLGSELLGIWSLILATSSIASIGGTGVTASLVKFVAEYVSQKKQIDRLVFTSLICTIVFYSIFSVVILFLSPFIFKQIIQNNFLEVANKILPVSLVILLINATASVFLSVLEGFQKNYLKNIILSISNLAFLGFTYFFLHKQASLQSVIYAQLIQTFLILILAYTFSAKLIERKKNLKWKWDNGIFKQLFSYSLKFQLISICQILYDPITKGLLGKFSGLGTVAYYEMANRLVMQFRNLIVSANQVVIPVIASLKLEAIESVKKIYIKSIQIISFTSLIMMLSILLFSNYISFIWIGSINQQFVACTNILAVGLFFNIICSPAYFSNIGEGQLNTLLFQHTFVGILNVGLGLLLSYLNVNYAAVWAWSISLFVGSMYIISIFQRKKCLLWKNIFNLTDFILFISATLFISFFLIISKSEVFINYFILSIKLLFLVIFICLLLYIKRKQIVIYFKKDNFK
jgi:O-antigen/teichoic acid export membrane protein